MKNASPYNSTLDRLKRDIQARPEVYFATACGVVSGLMLAKGLGWRKPPKIDEAKIVWNWMENQAKHGFNVYALNNEQKALWEAAWAYVIRAAEDLELTVPQAVNELTRSYLYVAKHGLDPSTKLI